MAEHNRKTVFRFFRRGQDFLNRAIKKEEQTPRGFLKSTPQEGCKPLQKTTFPYKGNCLFLFVAPSACSIFALTAQFPALVATEIKDTCTHRTRKRLRR